MIILKNLIDLLLMLAAYTLLFMWLPFRLRGYRLRDRGALLRLLSSYVLANVVIINIVYLLALLHIYNTFTLVVSLAACAAVYRMTRRRAETLLLLKTLETYFVNLKDGYYHPRVLLRDAWAGIKRGLGGLFLRRNYLNGLVLLVVFGFAAYTRWYHALTNMYYGASDMYAHTLWLKQLNDNNIFTNGVYPFGFHNSMSVLTHMGFDTVTVLRMMAPVQSMFVVFALYVALRSLFKSSLAVSVGLAFYCVMHVFTPLAIERQLTSLPQEWGLIFLYPCAVFLIDYMRERDTKSLVLFGLSVSLTLTGHPYILMYAAVLCVAVFVGHVVYMKRGMFIRLAAATMCGIMLSVAPLAAGLAMGIRLEPSFNYGVNLIRGSDAQEIKEQFEQPAVMSLPLSERMRRPLWTLEQYGFFDIGINNAAGVSKPWFFAFLVFSVGTLLMPVLPLKPRRRWDMASYGLYALITLLLRAMPIFDLPEIMEPHRLVSFFVFAMPFVMGAPVELLYELFHLAGKRLAAAWSVAAVVIGGGLCAYIAGTGQYGILPRIVQQQYDGAYYAYYTILADYPPFSWTIVSTSLEYSFCLGVGQHYNQSDFVRQLELGEDELIIPTKYVFVYVEKRPSAWSANLFLGKDRQIQPPFDPADAYLDMSEIFAASNASGSNTYLYDNLPAFRVLQAKTAAWVREYALRFPRECTVFYEDDELVVYRIVQNPLAPNDLKISLPTEMEATT